MAASQENAPAVAFEGVTPILRVRNVEASVEYYTDILGFQLQWRGPYFACVARDRCTVFLSEGDQGHCGSWVWIGVTDVIPLLEEYRQKSAKIRHLPTNYPWAYEMQVEDPDGNVLRIGSDSKSGEPTGEWLDMDGDRWLPTEGSSWTRVERM